MWQKVESDDDILSGRPGSRDHRIAGPSTGAESSFASRNIPSYSPHPSMYFPYPMAHSMFSGTGTGDARNRIGLSSHPYFSHLPRLGYSSSQPHLPPPPLPHMDGGGGGHYPRPGRPWWTVPPFPPPSHLHHPHHSHPPPNDDRLNDRPNSFQDNHPPISTQQTIPVSEPVSSTTSSVPRTTSRNAYTQQRLSILRKQQQKEQTSKNSKEQEYFSVLKSTTEAVSKNENLESTILNVNSSEDKGTQRDGVTEFKT